MIELPWRCLAQLSISFVKEPVALQMHLRLSEVRIAVPAGAAGPADFRAILQCALHELYRYGGGRFDPLLTGRQH